MKIALCFYCYFGKQNINTKKKLSQLYNYFPLIVDGSPIGIKKSC